MSTESRENSSAGLDEDELVAEAKDRIDDIEEEFGPDAPPRGSLSRTDGAGEE